MTLDFYDIAELCSAKMQLLSDVKRMNLSVEIPHIPERREGDNKAVRVVDDMFTLMAFLDENKKFDLLPRYVTDNTDSVPSSRLYEGDLSVLMRVIEKMEQEIKELNLALASFRREVVQQRLTETAHLSSHPDVNIGLGARSKVFPIQTGVPLIAGEDVMTSRDSPRRSADPPSLEAVPVVRDWAAAAASTPIPVHNRYSALASTDDEERDSEPFVEWSSRRSAKRRRVHSQQQQQQQRQRQQESRQHPATQRYGRGRGRGQMVMTGKSNSAAHQLTAARKIVRKAVFCVDNVDLSLDVDDLRHFVTGQLKVQVLSCFPVHPRRRRDDPKVITDRKAFRLCIAEADCDKLLNESKWPNSIVISAWYYKSPADATVRMPVPQGNSREMGEMETSGGRYVAHIESTANQEDAGTIVDNTVIYRAGDEAVAEITQQHDTINDGVSC